MQVFFRIIILVAVTFGLFGFAEQSTMAAPAGHEAQQ